LASAPSMPDRSIFHPCGTNAPKITPLAMPGRYRRS
jgi:hypothetical protein